MKQIKTSESGICAFAIVMYELLHPDIYHPWGKDFSCGSHDAINLSIIDAVKRGKRPPVLEVSAYRKHVGTKIQVEDPVELQQN